MLLPLCLSGKKQNSLRDDIYNPENLHKKERHLDKAKIKLYNIDSELTIQIAHKVIQAQ